MGSLSNNSRKLANFTGFYKGIQSAGNAIAATVDGEKAVFMTEFATNWGLLAGSLVFAAPVIWMKIQGMLKAPEPCHTTVLWSQMRARHELTLDRPRSY